MKKQLLGVALSLTLFASTATPALALKLHNDDDVQAGVGVGGLHTDVQIAGHVESEAGDRENDDGEYDKHDGNGKDGGWMEDKNDERGNATSTERNDGNRGDNERGEHASSTVSAKFHLDGSHGLSGQGIRSFFSWIFGLPASTTVGDIKAQLGATTTTSVGGESGGIFARGFFHAFLRLFGGNE